jgi:hypothetical protein
VWILSSKRTYLKGKSAADYAQTTGRNCSAGTRGKLSMPPILGARGVDPLMRFSCCDCGDVTTGEEVIRGAYVHVVKRNSLDLQNSVWRCECCQEELEDQQ